MASKLGAPQKLHDPQIICKTAFDFLIFYPYFTLMKKWAGVFLFSLTWISFAQAQEYIPGVTQSVHNKTTGVPQTAPVKNNGFAGPQNPSFNGPAFPPSPSVQPSMSDYFLGNGQGNDSSDSGFLH